MRTTMATSKSLEASDALRGIDDRKKPWKDKIVNKYQGIRSLGGKNGWTNILMA